MEHALVLVEEEEKARPRQSVLSGSSYPLPAQAVEGTPSLLSARLTAQRRRRAARPKSRWLLRLVYNSGVDSAG